MQAWATVKTAAEQLISGRKRLVKTIVTAPTVTCFYLFEEIAYASVNSC